MLAKLKSNPVTTILGLVAGAAGWISTQVALDAHPSAKTVLQILAAGAVAAFGAFASDAQPPK